MAAVTTFLTAAVLTPHVDIGNFTITKKFAVVAASALNGDNVQLFTISRNARLVGAHLRHSATLGASCTLKLQKNTGGVRTDITVVTTAGGASLVTGATLLPVDLVKGDIIEALVGGADIAAGANVEVDLVMASNKSI